MNKEQYLEMLNIELRILGLNKKTIEKAINTYQKAIERLKSSTKPEDLARNIRGAWETKMEENLWLEIIELMDKTIGLKGRED